MSTILGIISAVSICMAIHFTYLNKGTALMQYGAAVLLALIYAVTGVVLGVRSLMQKDIFRFFPVFGIALNTLTVAGSGFILYLGIIKS